MRGLNPAWIEGLGGAEILQQLLEAHAHDAFEDAHQFQEECDPRVQNYLSGLLFEPTPGPTETTAEAYADRLMAQLEKRWKQQRMAILEQDVKSNLFSGEELALKMAELTELWKTRTIGSGTYKVRS